MTTPLINTQDQQSMKAAFSMLSFPHKYFANPTNISRLNETFGDQKAVLQLIQLLNKTQERLVNYMNFSSQDIEGYKRFKDSLTDNSKEYVNVRSEISEHAPKELAESDISDHIGKFDLYLGELLNDLQVKLKEGELNSEMVSEILDCAWVVQHFALLVSGTLTLESKEDGSLLFKQKDPEMLTPIWFGNALEFLSQKAATNNILNLAFATYKKDKAMSESVQKLYARVLTIIPQHWRLGLGSKTKELFHEMADVIMLLTNVIQRKELDENVKPLSKGEVKKMVHQRPEKKGILKTFDLIKEFQKKNKPEDRLFDIKQGGLVLGSVELTRGLVQQMEYFAFKKQGPDWHSKLEGEQTRFLLDDLIECEHLDVLEFELKPDKFDSSGFPDLRLDVDFFVRDKSNQNVYAVQLKHVQLGTEAGLRAWFKLLGNKKSKLNTGVLQLERLHEVVKGSSSAREYLIKNGLTEDEVLNLKPMLVHNIGTLDCISLHNGIRLYDSYTFKKILTGCWGTIEYFKDGVYESSHTEPEYRNSVDLSDPINVIKAYTGEARFSELRYFDSARHLTRAVLIDGTRISAEGVGV